MNPVGKYVITLSIVSAAATFVASLGLRTVFSGRVHDTFEVISCFAILPLSSCLWHWMRFLRRKVTFRATEYVSLRCGELRFNEPARRYQLWIFCGTPLTRYIGEIEIVRDALGTTEVITIPRRNPLLYRQRSNFLPIVRKLDGFGSPCKLIFRLAPASPLYASSDHHKVTIQLSGG